MVSPLAGTAPLVLGLPNSPLAQLLVALVLLAVVMVVGRIILAMAWRIVVVAALVVAVVYGLSLAGL